MCQQDGEWHSDKLWAQIPVAETDNAVEQVKSKCKDIIKPEIPAEIVQSALENRLCKYRRDWQGRQRRGTDVTDHAAQMGSGGHENIARSDSNSDPNSSGDIADPMRIHAILSPED